MQLLLVRHGRAEDREAFAATGRDDDERPLTAKGIRRMKKAARGLRTLVPSIDVLVSSPLRRAVQTAGVLAEVYGGVCRIKRDELGPGADPQGVVEWLARQDRRGVACLVGHEPDLSELLALLLADESECPAAMKKGSAALVTFRGAPAVSGGSLKWYRTAAELGDRA